MAHGSEHQNDSPGNQNQPTGNVSNPKDTAPKSPCCEPTAAEKEHTTTEQRFWDRQIGVGWVLNIITGIGSVAALGALVVLFYTLRDARFATEEANRAWIAPRGMRLDTIHSSNTSKYLIMEYENIGKEPARDVILSKHIDIFDGQFVISDDSTGPAIGPNTTCKAAAHSGMTLWPIRSGGNQSTLWVIDDPTFLRDFNLTLSGIKTLYVQGCFTYSTFGGVHHSHSVFI